MAFAAPTLIGQEQRSAGRLPPQRRGGVRRSRRTRSTECRTLRPRSRDRSHPVIAARGPDTVPRPPGPTRRPRIEIFEPQSRAHPPAARALPDGGPEGVPPRSASTTPRAPVPARQASQQGTRFRVRAVSVSSMPTYRGKALEALGISQLAPHLAGLTVRLDGSGRTRGGSAEGGRTKPSGANHFG